ncbi:hypothetical protein ACFL0H_00295 [Thermodesulfobacteriota bacterium]
MRLSKKIDRLQVSLTNLILEPPNVLKEVFSGKRVVDYNTDVGQQIRKLQKEWVSGVKRWHEMAGGTDENFDLILNAIPYPAREQILNDLKEFSRKNARESAARGITDKHIIELEKEASLLLNKGLTMGHLLMEEVIEIRKIQSEKTES